MEHNQNVPVPDQVAFAMLTQFMLQTEINEGVVRALLHTIAEQGLDSEALYIRASRQRQSQYPHLDPAPPFRDLMGQSSAQTFADDEVGNDLQSSIGLSDAGRDEPDPEVDGEGGESECSKADDDADDDIYDDDDDDDSVAFEPEPVPTFGLRLRQVLTPEARSLINCRTKPAFGVLLDFIKKDNPSLEYWMIVERLDMYLNPPTLETIFNFDGPSPIQYLPGWITLPDGTKFQITESEPSVATALADQLKGLILGIVKSCGSPEEVRIKSRAYAAQMRRAVSEEYFEGAVCLYVHAQSLRIQSNARKEIGLPVGELDAVVNEVLRIMPVLANERFEIAPPRSCAGCLPFVAVIGLLVSAVIACLHTA